jgi:2-polyprenyl-3-methyl-5-hydroxy-6-metoxy-1,4-benzoquinol methylase
VDPIYHKSVHLNENQLLPPDTACPVCLREGIRPCVLTLQDNPQVDLVACGCGCHSASRMPKPEVLEDYYSRYYDKFEETATFDGSERFGVHLYGMLQSSQRSAMRILDFGGGVDASLSRSVAREFIDRGTERVAIALVDRSASCPRDWGAITVDCYQELQTGAQEFDIVLASAVIEHIPSPRGVLMALLNSLGAGGGIYFRTPAVSSLIRLTSRFGMHLDFKYPEHVHDMGQAFWEQLIPSLGLTDSFSIVKSQPSIVQEDFRAHPLRATLAHAMKSPWYLFRSGYTMVGGWEAVIFRTP